MTIAFLLGALILNHGSGHIIHSEGVSPAPTTITTKYLPLLKEASYVVQNPLEPVWVNQLRPAGTYPNGYAPGNCTYYVASRLPIPSNWGNANNWAYSAAMAGYQVSSVPKAGSIAQTIGDSYLGHVAVVESVNPDGSFLIAEMNAQGWGVIDERIATTTEFPNFILL